MGQATTEPKDLSTAKTIPRVTICTLTHNRQHYLQRLLSCIERQTYPLEKIEWLVLDDSTAYKESLDLKSSTPIQIKYQRLHKKMILGAKRNLAHRLCSGEIIVYMDDDDFYFPQRVQHAVDTLRHSKTGIAGCTYLPIYFCHDDQLWLSGPFGKNHARAATLAMTKEFAGQHFYDKSSSCNEEKSFLKNYTIPIQQLDPLQTMICISPNQDSNNKRYIPNDGTMPRMKLVDQRKSIAAKKQLHLAGFKHETQEIKTDHWTKTTTRGVFAEAKYDLSPAQHEPKKHESKPTPITQKKASRTSHFKASGKTRLNNDEAPEPLLSLEETWSQQINISKLLQHPKRAPTKDKVYSVNDKYGFGLSIKHFAGIAEDFSLPGIVPHGAGAYGCLNKEAKAPTQELFDKVPCIFASNQRCFDAFWNAGKRFIFPIGLASIYAHACLNGDKIQCNGSLFFRSHSTTSLVDQVDDSLVIQWLLSLPSHFHPIRISAFPFDWRRGIYKSYEDAGFQLVTAGTEYDQHFIWRHLNLIRSHQQILSTGMGTHVFHSILCGRPVLIKRFNEDYQLKNKKFTYDQTAQQEFQNLGSIFQQEFSEPTQKQISLTEKFLGTDHFLPPKALRSIIDLANKIHDSHQTPRTRKQITNRK